MSNKAITEIQSNNEECNFLQPHIGEGLNSKFFKIVRVGLFLLFIWTLIEIFKVKNTVEVIINIFFSFIIFAGFWLKTTYKQFLNHKSLYETITRNISIWTRICLYLLTTPILISILIEDEALLKVIGLINQDLTFNEQSIIVHFICVFGIFGCLFFIQVLLSIFGAIFNKRANTRMIISKNRSSIIFAISVLICLLATQLNILSDSQNLALLFCILVFCASRSLELFAMAVITCLTAISFDVAERF